MSSEVHFQEWARQGRCVLQALRWGLCTVKCLTYTKFGAVRPLLGIVLAFLKEGMVLA